MLVCQILCSPVPYLISDNLGDILKAKEEAKTMSDELSTRIIFLPLPYLVVTCWLLVDLMIQEITPIMSIDMTPTQTHGMSLVT